MPLTLTDGGLDWALQHAQKVGDTTSSHTFEFKAIAENWNEVKASIQDCDVLTWTVRPHGNVYVPKHRFGFRISTQLDPLDFLVFTALLLEVGEKIEATRIPASENIVHSFRFAPEPDGRMFSDKYTYRSFQGASHQLCDHVKPSHVAIADIADFFPRLYTHRIDGALDSVLGVGHMHTKALKDLISHWAGSYSYGIPVGPAGARLIAELAISDVDQILLSEEARYVRYSDDFRIFATSEADAYRQLTLVARALIENHGQTLQQHKTKIVLVERSFGRCISKRMKRKKSKRFLSVFMSSLLRLGLMTRTGTLL